MNHMLRRCRQHQAPQQLIALDSKALLALSEDEARGLGGMLEVVQDGVLPANFRGCRVSVELRFGRVASILTFLS